MTNLLLHLNPSRRVGKSYTTKGKLGSGSFGTVWRVECVGREGEPLRALKVIPKTKVKTDMKFVALEVEAMLRVQHPNVVKYYEYFEDAGSVYVVTELCTGGDFGELHSNSCAPEEIRLLFRDVTLGMSYFHNVGIAHRDLKFENCLLCTASGTRRMGKVIDFGLAGIRREGDTKGQWARESLGTKYFVAPEVLGREPRYGVKCDMWSLGVMMYILLTDEHPLAGNAAELDSRSLFRLARIGKVRREPLRWSSVGQDAQKLILDLLVVRPETRPDAAKALEYDWLRPQQSQATFRDHALKPQGTEAMRRLQSFGARSRFEKVVLMLAAHMATINEVKALSDAFIAIDTNASGTVSKDEFRNGLLSVSGVVDTSNLDFDALFAALDTNEDGVINYAEWLSGTVEPMHVASEKVMKDLFNFFDSDGKRGISLAELCAVIGDVEAKRVLQSGDTSGDGSLDYSEFQCIMKKIARGDNI